MHVEMDWLREDEDDMRPLDVLCGVLEAVGEYWLR